MNLIKFCKKIKYKIGICLNKTIWKFEYGPHLVLGKNITFRENLVINISDEGQVSIGDNTFFNNSCSINSQGFVNIGNNCLFGENVKIYDHNHIFNTSNKIIDEGFSVGDVRIGNNCWLGSNVVILKGTNIGDNCVIAAGSVVSGKVPDNHIYRSKKTQEIEAIIRKR